MRRELVRASCRTPILLLTFAIGLPLRCRTPAEADVFAPLATTLSTLGLGLWRVLYRSGAYISADDGPECSEFLSRYGVSGTAPVQRWICSRMSIAYTRMRLLAAGSHESQGCRRPLPC